MAQITVTLSEMEKAYKDLTALSQDFLEVSGKVISEAEALGKYWEGDSNTAFITEQRNANTWYNKMGELVAEYGRSLKTARDKYESTDREAAALIQSK